MRLKLIESVWRNKNCKTEQCFPRNEWNQPFRRFCRLYIGHYGRPLLFLNVPILERWAPHRIHQWPSLKRGDIIRGKLKIHEAIERHSFPCCFQVSVRIYFKTTLSNGTPKDYYVFRIFLGKRSQHSTSFTAIITNSLK